MSLNRTILMGRLCADPELRQTPNGVSVCAFRIAVNRNFGGQDGKQQADFIDIVAWRQSAEFVSKYFNKGKMIIVEGSIQTRSYEDKNGNKRTAVEVVADNVQFGESKGLSSSDRSDESAPAEPMDAPLDPQPSQDSDFSEMSGDSDNLPF
jgi:single-strand DNA-binding protein